MGDGQRSCLRLRARRHQARKSRSSSTPRPIEMAMATHVRLLKSKNRNSIAVRSRFCAINAAVTTATRIVSTKKSPGPLRPEPPGCSSNWRSLSLTGTACQKQVPERAEGVRETLRSRCGATSRPRRRLLLEGLEEHCCLFSNGGGHFVAGLVGDGFPVVAQAFGRERIGCVALALGDEHFGDAAAADRVRAAG
jgi:hypothetical protein